MLFRAYGLTGDISIDDVANRVVLRTHSTMGTVEEPLVATCDAGEAEVRLNAGTRLRNGYLLVTVPGQDATVRNRIAFSPGRFNEFATVANKIQAARKV